MVSLQKLDHEGLIHAVSSEQLIWGCVCYLNSVKHLFGQQFLKPVTNELILCSRGNSGSSFPVAVLMRASFIIELDGFCDCTIHFPHWLTFMSQSNGLSFLFAYLSCSCHNIELVFYQIGLYSVYHSHLVTTQLIGSNTLQRKEIPQMNFYEGSPCHALAIERLLFSVLVRPGCD